MERRGFLVSSATAATLGTVGCLGNGDSGKTGDDVDQPPDEDSDDEMENPFVTVWRTDNDGESGADAIRLPLLEAGTYDFTVEWGDGTTDSITAHDDAAAIHTYDEPGTSVVSIEGTLEGWSFVESPSLQQVTDAARLVEIRQWGDFDVGVGEVRTDYLESLPDLRTDFAGCQNLIVTAEDTPVIGQGASLAFLFAGTSLSHAAGLPSWDVSGVENTGAMFRNASSFDEALHEWDVSNVRDMRSMFNGASSFRGGVEQWDVSSVETMRGMFTDATGFDEDLNRWDTSTVRDTSFMFAGATAFDGDLSDWDVSRVEDMHSMFQAAESFDGDLTDWDVSSVETMRRTFQDAQSFDGDLRDWDVSKVRDTGYMFANARSFDSDLGNWDVSNVEDMEHMFENARSFEGGVGGWNVSNVTTMRHLFAFAESFDGDVSDWDVSNVAGMRWMFRGSGLTRENYDRLLLSWRDLDLQEGVDFSVGETRYSPGDPAAARQYIIDTYDWTISDGGNATEIEE